MNFELSDDQRTIKSTAREFLAARYPLEVVRRLALEGGFFSDAGWREIVELGWTEVAELGTVELAVVAEELGYALAPTPLQSTWAAGLLAPLEPAQRGAVAVDGVAADAGGADVLVAWDGSAARVFSGASIEPLQALDPTRPLFRVSGGSAGEPLEVGNGWLRATVMNAAESVGVAERAMRMAIEYAKERRQFGRPIGSYQAVSHPCAQMLLEVEGARSAVYWAAWALDHEPQSGALATACAKAYAGDCGRRVTRAALQVHGGIGFTWEHDLHLFLKRGEANAHAYGDGAAHRERVAMLAGL